MTYSSHSAAQGILSSSSNKDMTSIRLWRHARRLVGVLTMSTSLLSPLANAAARSRPTHALTAFTHDGAATIGLVFVALFAASCFLLIRSPADTCWEDAAGPEYVLPRFSKHYRAFLGVRIAIQEV